MPLESRSAIKSHIWANLNNHCLDVNAKCNAMYVGSMGRSKCVPFDLWCCSQDHCVDTTTITDPNVKMSLIGEHTHFIDVKECLTDFRAEQVWHQQPNSLSARGDTLDVLNILWTLSGGCVSRSRMPLLTGWQSEPRIISMDIIIIGREWMGHFASANDGHVG